MCNLKVLITCLMFVKLGNFQGPLVIQLEDGLFEGVTKVSEAKGVTYYKYEGIPYAEPPVGDLRFRRSIPNKKWNGTLRNDPSKASCIVADGLGNEDCLYLTVYTSNQPNVSGNSSVFAFIYGGGFTAGNMSADYANPETFVEENVVFVVFNYRLGIFGWMCTEDEEVRGNMGLSDQILALQWIQKNILRFGGNPNDVTLGGHSAGGASGGYLLLSALAKNLFHKLIMQSGNPLCLWSLQRNARNRAFNVGKKLGIFTSDSTTLVNRLRNVSAQDLQSAASSATIIETLLSNPLQGFDYAPVNEYNHNNAISSNKSHQSLTLGQFPKIPILMGFTSMEAIAAITLSQLAKLALAKYEVFPSTIVPIDMNMDEGLTKTGVGALIKQNYFGLSMQLASNYKLAEFISDDQFVRGTVEAARILSLFTSVFTYLFSHEGPLGQSFPRNESGVGHSEEICYLFKCNKTASATDLLVKSRMIRLWVNFIKTGNPTPVPDSLFGGTIWEKTNTVPGAVSYLNIKDDLEMQQNPNKKNLDLYYYLYRTFGKPSYDTY